MTTENRYGVPEYDTSHTEKDETAKTFSDTFQNRICGFYGIFLFVLGFVFPISTALAASSASDQDYLLALHVIMNLAGIGFIIHLLVVCIRADTCRKINTEEATNKTFTSVYWHPEGVSLYVRLGAILFGVATLLQGVFRLASECRGTIFEATYGLNVIFVLLQTVTLVRYHQACVSVRTFLARWGFAHLIAQNLSQWAQIVTAEITEGLLHKLHAASSHGDEHADDGHGGYLNDSLNDSVSGHHGSHDIHKRVAAAGPPGGCDFSGTLQYQAAPYLFPCIVEYSFVMAAISYRLYCNVNKQPQVEHEEAAKGKQCKFSFPYFISGIVGVLALIAAFTSVILIYEQKGEAISISFFYFLQFVLLFIALVALIPAIKFFMKLCPHKLEDSLDGNLLVVAFFLSLVLDIFTMIGSIAKFDSASDVARVSIFRVFFSIIQSMLQVMFILDALASRAKTKEQATAKPGRFLVFFLLLLNIALWIMAVFEIKIYKDNDVLEDFFGMYGWTIAKSMCTPLVIFFRFHSTVCLADIFTEAYHYHPHSN